MKDILEINYDEFEDDLNKKLYVQNIKNIINKSKDDLEKNNYYAHLIFPSNFNFIKKIRDDTQVIKRVLNLLVYIFSLYDFSLSLNPLDLTYKGETKYNDKNINKVLLSYLYPFLEEVGLKNVRFLIKSKI